MDHKTESVQNHRIFAKRKLLYNFFVLFFKKEMQKNIKRNIGSKGKRCIYTVYIHIMQRQLTG